jgi:SAM-dependent methyltransferase
VARSRAEPCSGCGRVCEAATRDEHGRPISATHLGQRLKYLRIQPGQARSTALFQLATELPASLLARMLGIHIDVAVAWQRASAGDWMTYAADVSRRSPLKWSTQGFGRERKPVTSTDTSPGFNHNNFYHPYLLGQVPAGSNRALDAGCGTGLFVHRLAPHTRLAEGTDRAPEMITFVSTDPGSATAYEMRSVAVPWGNCIEPSNVQAGGTYCPIRWQCPGCSHYRPDPSHLPAIEDQVRSLKASLETARAIGAARKGQAGTTEFATRIKDLTSRIGQQDAELARARTEITGLTQNGTRPSTRLPGSGRHFGR